MVDSFGSFSFQLIEDLISKFISFFDLLGQNHVHETCWEVAGEVHVLEFYHVDVISNLLGECCIIDLGSYTVFGHFDVGSIISGKDNSQSFTCFNLISFDMHQHFSIIGKHAHLESLIHQNIMGLFIVFKNLRLFDSLVFIESWTMLFHVILFEELNKVGIDISHPAITSADFEAWTFQLSLIHLNLDAIFLWNVNSFAPSNLWIVDILRQELVELLLLLSSHILE